MSHFLTWAKNTYINFRGFHTNRNLLVIESDDWGSIRMPSRQTFEHLQKGGDCPEADPFLRNDSLENETDLCALFDALACVSDGNGRAATMTANFAVANPNFDRISADPPQYSYEPFYETYQRYYPNQKVLPTIMEGKNAGCFFPQLHCREHMCVNRWMKDFLRRKEDTILAFENHMIGVGVTFSSSNRYGYMDAFNNAYVTEEDMAGIIGDAVALFTQTFGYGSKTFVASCFVWGKELERCLLNYGIDGIQSGAFQYLPKGSNDYRRKLHYTGERNSRGQIYTVRNCSYEPIYGGTSDEWVERCFFEIKAAFSHGKPAIVNTHRANYISSINQENTKNNLVGLRKLLMKVRDAFPDVEFLNSEELLSIIRNS